VPKIGPDHSIWQTLGGTCGKPHATWPITTKVLGTTSHSSPSAGFSLGRYSWLGAGEELDISLCRGWRSRLQRICPQVIRVMLEGHLSRPTRCGACASGRIHQDLGDRHTQRNRPTRGRQTTLSAYFTGQAQHANISVTYFGRRRIWKLCKTPKSVILLPSQVDVFRGKISVPGDKSIPSFDHAGSLAEA